jgi:hypothetical protein
VLNIATTPDDHRLASEIAGTLRTEFPEVLTWQPLRFNQIVVGRSGPLRPAGIRSSSSGDLAPLLRHMSTHLRAVKPSENPWTDDRAPVEWITDRMIVEFAAEGGRFEEERLPTLP